MALELHQPPSLKGKRNQQPYGNLEGRNQEIQHQSRSPKRLQQAQGISSTLNQSNRTIEQNEHRKG